ncbi:MAG: lipid A export permease/ATP-binding protein MsbA [Pseudomonadales bacterium]|jgi:subfamily B ATP-binding cassette protein MsbA|nr:lipid A export permease/ATP-binding protein MsbA [Pseudomonadales bacterium]
MTGIKTEELSSFALYKRLLSYLRPLWFLALSGIVGFALYGSMNLYFGRLVGVMIDSIQTGTVLTNDSRLIFPLTLVKVDDARLLFPVLLMLIVLLRGIGGFLGSYGMASLAFRIIHHLRCQVLERLLTLPVQYYDRNNSGHLISAVTFNVSQISAAVSDALAVLLREGATIIFIVGGLLYLNWKLTLIFVAITPLIALVVVYASGKFRKHSKRIQTSMGDVTQILSETLKGLKVIRVFGASGQIAERFNAVSDINTRQNLKLVLTAAISAPIIQFLVASALAFLLWLAMSPEVLAVMTPGQFVEFITLAGMLLKPVRQTSKTNSDIQKGLAAASSIFALLDTPQEQDTGVVSVARVRGDIEFRDVGFGYSESTDAVLRGVNLHCRPGQTVAIVGRSGSGKSTLVNLLPRFYELQSGQILLDGVAHSDYTLANLRHHIALVSQQVVLFNGSIRDNVAQGELKGASDELLREALRHANALEFIDALPLGLDTLVGDDGLLLSGGQRQRLAIARALLKDAPILILDEATSALDTASERYIQNALDYLMQGRTTLVIAHRLSTIEKADLIVVMEQGQIVEQGTHQALLKLGGAYAQLHSMQFTEIIAEP